jgi:hypothetical protein
MSDKTGGPAFPQAYEHVVVLAQMHKDGELDDAQLKQASRQLAGMTLRDYFAGKAMQGLMGRVWGNQPAEELFPIWAKSAYAVADAMLKARGQT